MSVADDTTPIDQLVVFARSSDQSIVPDQSLEVRRRDDWTQSFELQITPGTKSGSTTITVFARDLQGAITRASFELKFQETTPLNLFFSPVGVSESDGTNATQGFVSRPLALSDNALTVTINSGGSCLLYTSPSPRDNLPSRMPSSA